MSKNEAKSQIVPPPSTVGAMHWDKLETIRLANHDIVTASRARLAEAMTRDCISARSRGLAGPPRLVFDVNGHGISLAASDPAYRALVEEADIIHADGGFLVTISKLFNRSSIAERSATTDLFHDFAKGCVKHNLTMYLLGATEEVNSQCAAAMQIRYPGLLICGRRNGYYSADEEAAIVEEINSLSPDILWVGLGKPREQQFAVRWKEQFSVRWLVTCGGCFNYVTGHYTRAPRWMQQLNLEWMYRSFSNPKHLLWRYVTTSPHALWIVLRSVYAGRKDA